MKPGDQLSLLTSKATARSNDPQTSKDAANALNNAGVIPEHESDIIRALRNNPGSTARQLGLEMASKLSGIDKVTCEIIVNEYRKPHSRLAAMGDKVRIEPAKPGNKYFILEK